MNTITTKDGVEIFYKDWGQGQPCVFHHGWPLSSDDWDAQMLFFLHHGYRVVEKAKIAMLWERSLRPAQGCC
jgi:non-heme chloroperoxidase